MVQMSPSVIAALSVAEVLWIIVASVVLILQRRSAAATLAWIFALIFLPGIGLLFYVVIGPRRLARRKLRRKLGRQSMVAATEGVLSAHAGSPSHARLAQIPVRAGETPPLRCANVRAYIDGRSAYEAIFAAISAAKHHVHVEYYILEPDRAGERLRSLLIEKAKAGVEVRLVIDGTGSIHVRNKWLEPLREAGVEVAWFNPINLFRVWFSRPDFRTHRKIVVCDGRLGFTGGMNLAECHSAEFTERYWRDTHMSFEGDAVWALQRAFFEDWAYATQKKVSDVAKYFPKFAGADDVENDALQIVGSGPDTDDFAVHKTFFAAITAARKRVWLETPYFIPDETITQALAVAALSGVDVRVIVPERGDSRVVDLAARSYFDELLKVGVRFFEYTPRFLHAKTFVIDDDLSIVGTANLDNRSFKLDFELAAVAYGAGLNRVLAEAFIEDLKGCREVKLGESKRLPLATRLGQATARLLSPLL
ncbi:MAG: cardiolipin synthase [Polyangiales bacterium]